MQCYIYVRFTTSGVCIGAYKHYRTPCSVSSLTPRVQLIWRKIIPRTPFVPCAFHFLRNSRKTRRDDQFLQSVENYESLLFYFGFQRTWEIHTGCLFVFTPTSDIYIYSFCQSEPISVNISSESVKSAMICRWQKKKSGRLHLDMKSYLISRTQYTDKKVCKYVYVYVQGENNRHTRWGDTLKKSKLEKRLHATPIHKQLS